MSNTIEITPVNPRYREAIISLLQSEGLPIEDLQPGLQDFLTAADNGVIIGAIGLETYGLDGLLRSLVVRREYRNMKIAAGLINKLEELANSKGLRSIYLLTKTAQDYFSKKGYKTIARNEAPAALQQSTEFSHVCPSSAILMKKQLSNI